MKHVNIDAVKELAILAPLTNFKKQTFLKELSWERKVMEETWRTIDTQGIDIDIRTRLEKCPNRLLELSYDLQCQELEIASAKTFIIVHKMKRHSLKSDIMNNGKFKREIIKSIDEVIEHLKNCFTALGNKKTLEDIELEKSS